MNKIEKPKYVNKKYPRKVSDGVMFLFIWGIVKNEIFNKAVLTVSLLSVLFSE